MKKTAILALIAGITLGAAVEAAGPVYTVPADYEKMRKVVQGLVGSDNLTSVDDTVAKNTGANIRSYIEGTTGKSVASTYSPTYFKAYGNNYRQLATGLTGTDPGGTTTATNFQNAGRNVRDVVYVISGQEPTTSNAYVNPTRNSSVGNIVYQFKQRADQTFYDTYLNDKALKKSFTFASGFNPNNYREGLTPITEGNEAKGLGSAGFDDTFTINPDIQIKEWMGHSYPQDGIVVVSGPNHSKTLTLVDVPGSYSYTEWCYQVHPEYVSNTSTEIDGHTYQFTYTGGSYTGSAIDYTTCYYFSVKRDGNYIGQLKLCARVITNENGYTHTSDLSALTLDPSSAGVVQSFYKK